LQIHLESINGSRDILKLPGIFFMPKAAGAGAVPVSDAESEAGRELAFRIRSGGCALSLAPSAPATCNPGRSEKRGGGSGIFFETRPKVERGAAFVLLYLSEIPIFLTIPIYYTGELCPRASNEENARRSRPRWGRVVIPPYIEAGQANLNGRGDADGVGRGDQQLRHPFQDGESARIGDERTPPECTGCWRDPPAWRRGYG
jgi:hypothetical protein